MLSPLRVFFPQITRHTDSVVVNPAFKIWLFMHINQGMNSYCDIVYINKCILLETFYFESWLNFFKSKNNFRFNQNIFHFHGYCHKPCVPVVIHMFSHWFSLRLLRVDGQVLLIDFHL